MYVVNRQLGILSLFLFLYTLKERQHIASGRPKKKKEKTQSDSSAKGNKPLSVYCIYKYIEV